LKRSQSVQDALADAAQLRAFAFEFSEHCYGNWSGSACEGCAQAGLVPDPSEYMLDDPDFMVSVAALAFRAVPALRAARQEEA
jgi:hypothetical protein